MAEDDYADQNTHMAQQELNSLLGLMRQNHKMYAQEIDPRKIEETLLVVYREDASKAFFASAGIHTHGDLANLLAEISGNKIAERELKTLECLLNLKQRADCPWLKCGYDMTQM